MNDNFSDLLKRLTDEVTEIHYRWDMYKEVFFGGADQTQLLNQVASNFFYYTQHLMLDHLSLSLSKLTDPNRQGKNENLSLEQIHVFASENGDFEFSSIITSKFNELKEACLKFRNLRNKRIAHNDFNEAMGLSNEPIEGISYNDCEHALQVLREYMDLVELKYTNSQTGYTCIQGPRNSGGQALIDFLRKNV